MKKNTITIIFILLFVLLGVMAVSAINKSDVDKINGVFSTLSNIQLELQAAKGTNDISATINVAAKLLNKAVSNPGSGCASMLKTSLLKLDQAKNKLSSRSCTNLKRKNCIPDNLVNKVLTDLQNATNNLKEVITLDVCKDDPDGDGLTGKKDNCPLVSNLDQLDADKNGIGDDCELFYCCESSSLKIPLEECELKTIESCSEEGGIIIGGIPPLKSNARRNKSILRNSIDFGGLSTVTVNTGFFPFASSQNVLNTFDMQGCSTIELTFTPPVGFSGGALEVGPAANNLETGPRTTIQFNGDMSSTITLNNFPTTNPSTGQLFSPSMGDVLGLSLFTTSQTLIDATFYIFADVSKNCVVAPGSSSGETGSSSGGTSSGGTVVVAASSSGDFNTMLLDALAMSTVPTMQGGMQYMATVYDCDDFANDLQMELQGQGFNSSFTLLWRDNGMWGHVVTDVHSPDGMITFVEPQDGTIIPLDEDGDGMVNFSDGMHSMNFMTTEGMTQVEVYMDQDTAVMAGVILD